MEMNLKNSFFIPSPTDSLNNKFGAHNNVRTIYKITYTHAHQMEAVFTGSHTQKLTVAGFDVSGSGDGVRSEFETGDMGNASN